MAWTPTPKTPAWKASAKPATQPRKVVERIGVRLHNVDEPGYLVVEGSTVECLTIEGHPLPFSGLMAMFKDAFIAQAAACDDSCELAELVGRYLGLGVNFLEGHEEDRIDEIGEYVLPADSEEIPEPVTERE